MRRLLKFGILWEKGVWVDGIWEGSVFGKFARFSDNKHFLGNCVFKMILLILFLVIIFISMI